MGTASARRIPLLHETEVRPLRVVQRQTGSKTPANLADKPPLENILPMELAAGDQIVIDAGRFVQAYCEIEMTADEGSQIDIAYANVFQQRQQTGAAWVATEATISQGKAGKPS